MKRVNKRPTSGQFVLMWRYQDEIWASVYRMEDDELQEYDGSMDDWLETISPLGLPGVTEVEYYVLD